jgi:hypothetical protein
MNQSSAISRRPSARTQVNDGRHQPSPKNRPFTHLALDASALCGAATSWQRTAPGWPASRRVASGLSECSTSVRRVPRTQPTLWPDDPIVCLPSLAYHARDSACGPPASHHARPGAMEAALRSPRWTAQLWCTGKDSNLRTSLGGADLQSAGFNHSPTCAETAPLRAEKTLPWTLRSSHTPPESPVHRQLRETEICARTAAQEHIYPSEKFLMECVWKTCRAAASAALPGKSLSGAGEGIRTPDPLITNQMLYQLSYASTQGFRPLRRKSPC